MYIVRPQFVRAISEVWEDSLAVAKVALEEAERALPVWTTPETIRDIALHIGHLAGVTHDESSTEGFVIDFARLMNEELEKQSP